jgi:transketolase
METDMKQKARQIRRDLITALYRAGSGHPGGSLSEVEILLALYYHKMRIRPEEPDWEDRDRFILSKGHANPALYAVLADLGYFPKEDLWRLRKGDGHLQGHPDRNKTPGIDMSTGSLGQGMAVACGAALGAKQQKKDWQVYALAGDGELQEGIAWECAMSAVHYRLDNYTLIVDVNGLQIDGATRDVMDLGDLAAKFAAFGFEVLTVEEGNDCEALCQALDRERTPGKPRVILARTTKGKGVSFMENQAGWHGKGLDEEHYRRAMEELGEVSGWKERI